MLDVHVDRRVVISTCKDTNPALSNELTQEWEQLDRVHRSIAHSLLADESWLKGFIGRFKAVFDLERRRQVNSISTAVGT